MTFDAHFPNYKDEGGAPTSVVLRLQAVEGRSLTFRHQLIYLDPVTSGESVFDMSESDVFSKVKPDEITTNAIVSTLTTERDDLKTASKLRSVLVGKPYSVTMDYQGHLISSAPPDNGDSLDFPTAPVSAGADWTGSTWWFHVQLTTVVHLDKIIRYHGHVLVQLTMTAPPALDTKRFWVDATAGSVGAEEDLEVLTTQNGHGLYMRIFDLPTPPAGIPEKPTASITSHANSPVKANSAPTSQPVQSSGHLTW